MRKLRGKIIRPGLSGKNCKALTMLEATEIAQEFETKTVQEIYARANNIYFVKAFGILGF